MDPTEYLEAILQSQEVAGKDLKALQDRRDEVETFLRKKFGHASPSIRYGGSKAKGTMIVESYDLDLICYFPHDENGAGGSLEEIYNNVRELLGANYRVEPKPSALRLLSTDSVDFHVDVVPGRFTDTTKTDVFLHRSTGDKVRLKTNLETHIAHVRDSGVTGAIRLAKLWRVRKALAVRNFILELVVIEVLKGMATKPIAVQLTHVFSELRDNAKNIAVKDPANPSGNDLSALFDLGIQSELSLSARDTLTAVAQFGWERVFGPVDTRNDDERRESLHQAAASVAAPTRPWCRLK